MLLHKKFFDASNIPILKKIILRINQIIILVLFLILLPIWLVKQFYSKTLKLYKDKEY